MLLSLDISTSCTGWAVFSDNKLVLAGAIQTPTAKPGEKSKIRKFNNLFEKMDFVIEQIKEIVKKNNFDVKFVVAEAAFKKFAMGKSSANVIAMLIGFNFCLTYHIVRHFGATEKFLDAKNARKVVGISVKKGEDAKEKVMQFIEPKFSELSWPKKKTGTPVDWTIDMADAIVIGLAALKLSEFEPVV